MRSPEAEMGTIPHRGPGAHTLTADTDGPLAIRWPILSGQGRWPLLLHSVGWAEVESLVAEALRATNGYLDRTSGTADIARC